MSFLLYIPGPVQGDKQARLREVGLEAFAGGNTPTVEFRELIPPETSPDGGTGLLLRLCHGAKSPLDPPHAYRPDQQEWTPCAADATRGLAKGRYWMGRGKSRVESGETRAATAGSAPLAEAYCRRPRPFDARPVTLLDGAEWRMPVPRWLPRDLRLDEAGAWTQQVKPELADYWEQSEALFAAALAGSAYKLEFALPYVLRGLALNYCLTPELVSWLGLLDSDVVMQAVSASFEWPQIQAIVAAAHAAQEAAKKNSPAAEDASTSMVSSADSRDSSGPGPGSAAPCPATPPPG